MSIKLYHVTSRSNAMGIIERQFHDSEGSGIRLRARQPHDASDEGAGLRYTILCISLDLEESQISRFRKSTSKGSPKEWIIPAGELEKLPGFVWVLGMKGFGKRPNSRSLGIITDEEREQLARLREELKRADSLERMFLGSARADVVSCFDSESVQAIGALPQGAASEAKLSEHCREQILKREQTRLAQIDRLVQEPLSPRILSYMYRALELKAFNEFRKITALALGDEGGDKEKFGRIHDELELLIRAKREIDKNGAIAGGKKEQSRTANGIRNAVRNKAKAWVQDKWLGLPAKPDYGEAENRDSWQPNGKIKRGSKKKCGLVFAKLLELHPEDWEGRNGSGYAVTPGQIETDWLSKNALEHRRQELRRSEEESQL
jgi:hypothetical protein